MKKKRLVVLCLLIISLAIITGTYTLYKSRGIGSANMTAARWNVSLLGDNDDIELTSGSTGQDYLLTVKNESEVSVSYVIKITNLPDGVKVKLDTGSYQEEINNEVLFDDDRELLITGTTQRNHVLTFSAPLDTEEIVNQKIKIDVEFKQKVS